MLRTISLGDLRGAALDRADVRGRPDRYTPAEVNEYINQSIAHLRDLLIQAKGDDYFSLFSDPPISIVQGQQFYALPDDCYTILSVRVQLGPDTTSTYILEPFNSLEEADLLMISASTAGAFMKYRITSTNQIQLLPQGPTNALVFIRYMAPAPRLVDDADLFDGFNGWEEFVVLDAARKIATKGKEWETVNALKADIAVMTNRIKSLATRRDVGRPEVVADVRGMRKNRAALRYRFGY